MLNKIIIAACSPNGNIGLNLPWLNPVYLSMFDKLTEFRAILMGRKTFEKAGKPLINRMNIVVSKDNAKCMAERVMSEKWITTRNNMIDVRWSIRIVRDIHIGFDCVEKVRHNSCCIVGGESIYKECLPIANEIVLTVFQDMLDDGPVFPMWPIDLSRWNQVEDASLPGGEKRLRYKRKKVKN